METIRYVVKVNDGYYEGMKGKGVIKYPSIVQDAKKAFEWHNESFASEAARNIGPEAKVFKRTTIEEEAHV